MWDGDPHRRARGECPGMAPRDRALVIDLHDIRAEKL
jgi:hypothetical protein